MKYFITWIEYSSCYIWGSIIGLNVWKFGHYKASQEIIVVVICSLVLGSFAGFVLYIYKKQIFQKSSVKST